jgi:hypothetical protein
VGLIQEVLFCFVVFKCYCGQNSVYFWRDADTIGCMATMKRQQLLDVYFLDARSKLIDLAAFLDRLDRADGEADFRLAALNRALQELGSTKASRAEQVLLSLSDPTNEPIPAATTKAACGAWAGKA